MRLASVAVEDTKEVGLPLEPLFSRDSRVVRGEEQLVLLVGPPPLLLPEAHLDGHG